MTSEDERWVIGKHIGNATLYLGEDGWGEEENALMFNSSTAAGQHAKDNGMTPGPVDIRTGGKISGVLFVL